MKPYSPQDIGPRLRNELPWEQYRTRVLKQLRSKDVPEKELEDRLKDVMSALSIDVVKGLASDYAIRGVKTNIKPWSQRDMDAYRMTRENISSYVRVKLGANFSLEVLNSCIANHVQANCADLSLQRLEQLVCELRTIVITSYQREYGKQWKTDEKNAVARI